ncbi:hypothetical protein E2C01_060313 [Portunus trituberculatus]|uniref:Uncharacterized protein n=1 Tax=Portunus trituberculatus TaxID=210409 RepID=A0A5B7HA45_PORTR|nr:hypothetical protein [Portunus trituberculatus]
MTSVQTHHFLLTQAQDTQQKRKRAASVSVRMQEPRVKRMMDFEEISEREEEDLEMDSVSQRVDTGQQVYNT